MKKKKFLERLAPELERLANEEHLSYLANNGRYAEVDEIEARIDTSVIKEYMNQAYEDDDWEQISVLEIPNGRYLEFISCLRSSECYECEIMENHDDLQIMLRSRCGIAGKKAAKTMDYESAIEFGTYAEFMEYEPEEEEEE